MNRHEIPSVPSRALLILIGSSIMAACGPSIATLQPAPGASVAPNDRRAATAAVAGVSVVAHAEAWQWNPRNLKDQVTPILLEFRNEGNRPVEVRYNRIWLTDSADHRLSAMPPYDIDGTVVESFTVREPYYGFSRFSVAPYLSRWYPGWSRYNGAFSYDPAYYGPRVTRYRDIRLPTSNMVSRALPEGVLEPGGKASGFVYFEALHEDDHSVTVTVEIVEAGTSNVLGTVRIPFVTQ